MKRILGVCLLSAAALPASVEDRETIRRTYSYAAKLDVENVNGSIHVTGYGGSAIQLVANRRTEAKDSAALEAAKREVRLDVTSSGGVLRVCIDAPWKDCGDPENRRGRNWHGDRNYSVRFDFELQVPSAMAAKLKTVNGGVTLNGVSGDFEVSSVNGGLTLEDMAGSGSAKTVNGAIRLSFRNSPQRPVNAKTVNGAIDAAFPKNLNANLRFKTFHGDVFTDFPSTALAQEAAKAEREGGRTVIRGNRVFGVKVGGGGPEHFFETLNGTIQIKERQ